MNKSDYIKKYSSIASQAGAKYGIAPTVILAQSAHESGWGSSSNVKEANNYFGVTAAGGKNEYWDGRYRTASTGLKFRVYRTPLDSFMDFGRLIKSKYPNSAKVSNNTAAYARSIAQSAYISEQNGDNRSVYEKAINSIAKDIKNVMGTNWSGSGLLIAGSTALMIGVILGITILIRQHG